MEADSTANANVLRKQFQQRSLNNSSMQNTEAKGQSIIIVGAGAFGSSLALELVTHYRDKWFPSFYNSRKVHFGPCIR